MRVGGFDFGLGSSALKRYHFDLENSPEIIKHREDVEASGLEIAVTRARAVTAQMRDDDELAEPGAWTLFVRDADGTDLSGLTVK